MQRGGRNDDFKVGGAFSPTDVALQQKANTARTQQGKDCDAEWALRIKAEVAARANTAAK